MNNRLLILSLVTLVTANARAQAPATDTTPEAATAMTSPAPLATSGADAQAPAAPTQPAVQTAHPVGPYPPNAQNPVRADAAVQFQLPQPYVTPPPAPPPREPRRHGRAGAPFALALGPGFVWRGAAGTRPLTSDAANSGFELLATYDVWAPSPRVIMAAGIDTRFEHLGDPDALAVWHRMVQAELQPRFQLTRWLWPHVRAAFGVVVTRFRLEGLDSVDFEDRDAHVASTLGAGFTLRTPSRLFETHRGRLSSFSIGLTIEGGYTYAKAARLQAEPTADSELARATFSLGELARSGAYLRALVALRF